MDVQIITRDAQQVAYIRVSGPYDETMPDGFNRLMAWAEPRQLLAGDWLALYWNNPEITPPQDLRADVALSVPVGTEVSGEVQLQTVPQGLYACYRCRVENDDFATPWNALFRDWLPQSGYQPAAGPCFEQYLNNGRQDGYWDLLIHTPVQPRA
jgi:DNA gyrase inhibitor